MIDLYYWTTPNGHIVTMALEEMALRYRVLPIDINKGDQFKPDYRAIAPNGRIPALVDHAPPDGGAPMALFESAAILIYLAETSRRLLPSDPRRRSETLQWLTWQTSNLAPMAAEAYHFGSYAENNYPNASDRFISETTRLFGVLDRHLATRRFITGDDYSIADIACYPWIIPHRSLGQSIADFPNLKRWMTTITQRPGTARAYAVAKSVNPQFGRAP
jgi:GST-like protein